MAFALSETYNQGLFSSSYNKKGIATNVLKYNLDNLVVSK